MARPFCSTYANARFYSQGHGTGDGHHGHPGQTALHGVVPVKGAGTALATTLPLTAVVCRALAWTSRGNGARKRAAVRTDNSLLRLNMRSQDYDQNN